MRNVCAALFALLAVSNFLKPLQLGGAQTGFVLFGQRLSGTANTIAGPLFGLYLLLYALAIRRRWRIALPLGGGYTVYVVLNLVLYVMRNPRPPGASYAVFMIVYALVAIGVSAGSVVMLARQRADI